MICTKCGTISDHDPSCPECKAALDRYVAGKEMTREQVKEWSEYYVALDRWYENKGLRYDRPESPASRFRSAAKEQP
jgi:hypothetical protein